MLIGPTWVKASGYGSKAGVICMKGRMGTQQYSPQKYNAQSKGPKCWVGIGAKRRQKTTRSRDHEINEGRLGERAGGMLCVICNSPRILRLMPTYVVVRYPRCMRSEKHRLGGSGL